MDIDKLLFTNEPITWDFWFLPAGDDSSFTIIQVSSSVISSVSLTFNINVSGIGYATAILK